MEFVRSRKAQSVAAAASPFRHPQGKSSGGNFPLENANRELDSSSAAVLSQKPQEVEMEGEEEELPPPPAVMGMMDSEQTLLWFTRRRCTCSSFLLLMYNLAAKTEE